MLARLRLLWTYRELVLSLVARDLRVKYKGSVLGVAWSLVNPLAMVAVYTLAFQVVIRVRVPHFPVFLLAGFLPWTWFSLSISQAVGSMADSAPLIKKVAFPRETLPLALVLSNLVQCALAYALLIPAARAFGVPWSAALVALPLLFLLQLLFTWGGALLVATAYPFFRDARHLAELGLQLLFWLTPIVYSLSQVPERFQRWIRLNPMALFATAYQRIVLEQALPDAAAAAALSAVSVAMLVAGYAVFLRFQPRFAELV